MEFFCQTRHYSMIICANRRLVLYKYIHDISLLESFHVWLLKRITDKNYVEELKITIEYHFNVLQSNITPPNRSIAHFLTPILYAIMYNLNDTIAFLIAYNAISYSLY